eukprot:Rhum_TRINITY_DN15211_c19_g1::Rhum_TRINITY_DN15211_c19_g1_i1::g.144999::m.144999
MTQKQMRRVIATNSSPQPSVRAYRAGRTGRNKRACRARDKSQYLGECEGFKREADQWKQAPQTPQVKNSVKRRAGEERARHGVRSAQVTAHMPGGSRFARHAHAPADPGRDGHQRRKCRKRAGHAHVGSFQQQIPPAVVARHAVFFRGVLATQLHDLGNMQLVGCTCPGGNGFLDMFDLHTHVHDFVQLHKDGPHYEVDEAELALADTRLLGVTQGTDGQANCLLQVPLQEKLRHDALHPLHVQLRLLRRVRHVCRVQNRAHERDGVRRGAVEASNQQRLLRGVRCEEQALHELLDHHEHRGVKQMAEVTHHNGPRQDHVCTLQNSIATEFPGKGRFQSLDGGAVDAGVVEIVAHSADHQRKEVHVGEEAPQRAVRHEEHVRGLEHVSGMLLRMIRVAGVRVCNLSQEGLHHRRGEAEIFPEGVLCEHGETHVAKHGVSGAAVPEVPRVDSRGQVLQARAAERLKHLGLTPHARVKAFCRFIRLAAAVALHARRVLVALREMRLQR